MKKFRKGAVKTALLVCLSLVLCSCTAEEQSLENIDPSKYVTLGQYKAVTVDKIDTTVSESDIEDAVMSDLSALASKTEVKDRPVIEGDTVNIDYVGKKDGVAFDGGTASGYDLTIGSHTFIDGFEEGVTGMEIGETKDLELTFPEDYHSEELAGADVVFTVTVNSIQADDVPAITDDGILEKLADKYEAEKFDDVDEYLDLIKGTIEKSKEEAAQSSYRSELMQQIYDASTCDLDKLPEWLVSENTTQYTSNIESFASQYGLSLDEYVSLISGNMADFAEQAADYGREISKQELVIRAIAKAENIAVDEKEVVDYYASKAKEYGTDVDTLKKSVDEKTLTEYLLSEKVQDFVLDNAVIK
ncbi:MAG: trigger factor [Lachnospiraceae bacterium]|nr:trigger factor [Lachnospiraceae bacterium]